MSQEKLNVEGMSCDHCKMTVSKAVSALSGVQSVQVSLEEKTVAVDFDETVQTLSGIKEAIENSGYQIV
jgi:copper chaperone